GWRQLCAARIFWMNVTTEAAVLLVPPQRPTSARSSVLLREQVHQLLETSDTTCFLGEPADFHDQLDRIGKARLLARDPGALPLSPPCLPLHLALEEIDQVGADLDAALSQVGDDLLDRSCWVLLEQFSDGGRLVNAVVVRASLRHCLSGWNVEG